MTDELDRARREIDDLDRALVILLAKRMRTIERVARAKLRAGGMPVRDPEREREVVASWRETALVHGLDPETIRPLLDEVLRLSRMGQEQILDDEGG